jgi:hypothetical protein
LPAEWGPPGGGVPIATTYAESRPTCSAPCTALLLRHNTIRASLQQMSDQAHATITAAAPSLTVQNHMLPDYFGAIGSDRFLTLDEVAAHVRTDRARRCASPSEAMGSAIHGNGPGATPVGFVEAWKLYEQSFDGFCETTLDPQFHRLVHPATHTGSIHLDRSEPIVIVGTGPSLERHAADLRRARERIRIFTSPRGIEVLARHGLDADLVLVEHRTALDAHHSGRSALDGNGSLKSTRALVAADWRTPAAVLAGVDRQRLFVPDRLPTWGLWPATLAALAIQSGATSVGLLGVDLGTADRPNPTFAPLFKLLSWMACATGVTAIDCGTGGAGKIGWLRGTLEDLAASSELRSMICSRSETPSADYRRAVAFAAVSGLSRHIDDARRALATALRGRAGHVDAPALHEHLSEMLSWRTDPSVRVAIQETLGISFLPRLWRMNTAAASLDESAWRPVLLAAHEFVTQADRLTSAVLKDAA